MSAKDQQRKSALTIFYEAAYSGWMTSTKVILPALLFSYPLTVFLKTTKLLDVIGIVFQPLMHLFGLPGEAAMVIILGLVGQAAGIGMLASLVSVNILSGLQIAIISVGLVCSAGVVPRMGRVLRVSGIPEKSMGWFFLINIINALVGMAVMKIICLFIA